MVDLSPPELHQKKINILVWDWPLRLFHWLLVISTITAIITAKIGGELIDLHEKTGLLILGLLSFRIAWGFLGSNHARFSSFWPTYSKIKRYLRGNWQERGHNPLGALSVLAMLCIFIVQASLGLFSNDDIAFNGPLYHWVGKSLSDTLTGWHHRLSNLIYAFILLHIAAIIFYVRIKKQKLIRPMISGFTQIAAGSTEALPPERTNIRSWFALILALFFAASIVYIASDNSPITSTQNTSEHEQEAAPAW